MIKSFIKFSVLPFLNYPIKLEDDFIEINKLAAQYPSVFSIFKRQPGYRKVLEHVTREQGDEYLKITQYYNINSIVSKFDKYKENDVIGSPVTYRYRPGNFSPTTLRYIKVLNDLSLFFGSLDNLNIVEVGPAYGGQCKIITDTYKPRSYTVIDLPDVLLLTKKYLNYFNIKNIKYIPSNKIITDIKSDFVISNYAFSELKKSEQDLYLNHILKNVERGYITYNAEHMIKHVYKNREYTDIPYSNKKITNKMSRLHKIYVFDERPNTAKGNIIITWGLSRKFTNNIHIHRKYFKIITK